MIIPGNTGLASDFISASDGTSGKVATTINGKIDTSFLRFGGTGSDGALSISSGTTTIDCAGALVVVKNYLSISITGTGKLAFINPNANGTTIILKSMGNVTLTSSSAPMIDLSGMGAAGGATAGTAGNDAYSFLGICKGGATTAGTSYGASNPNANSVNIAYLYKSFFMFGPGAGGAAGQNGSGPSNAPAGLGGRGGGALILECGGALNFTTSGGISTAGKPGTSGTTGSAGGTPSSGGAGGGAGTCHILYNVLTANTGTITITGGAAGSGGGDSSVGTNWTSTNSAGGGASINNQATGGVVSVTVGTHDPNNAGQTGANAFSLVLLNTEFC